MGEKRFLKTMREADDMTSLLKTLRQKGYPPGAQRAFIMAKVLEKTDVIIVGSKTPDIVKKAHMIPVPDMAHAFHLINEKMGQKALDVLIVPHAMLTLPVLQNTSNPKHD